MHPSTKLNKTLRLNLQIDRVFTLPFSCVNRGAQGEIKTTTLGGLLRARISGQSLKRSNRELTHDSLKELEKAIRATNLVPSLERIWKEREIEIDLSESDKAALKSNLTAIGTAGGAKGKIEKNALVFISMGELTKIAQHLSENRDELTALCSVQTFDAKKKAKEVAKENGISLKKVVIKTADGKEAKDIPAAYDTEETLERIIAASKEGNAFILNETEADLNASKKKSVEVKTLDKASQHILNILTSNSYGADVALNGRMNAGCGDASVDSTSMFSHAITVGVHEVEEDYFVAKDESEKKTHNGGGMIDHTEGSSGTYYTFVNLDVASLYEKLTSQGYTKEEVIDLVLVFAKNSILSLPKAKQSTMFGRTLPHYARVTLKPDALVFMRSNPFVKPTYGSDEGMAEETIARLKEYDKEEEAFGIDNFLVKQEISKEGGSMQETLKAVKEKLQEVLP